MFRLKLSKKIIKITRNFSKTNHKFICPPHVDIKNETSTPSLEVKDPQIIFNYVMKSLEEKKGGKHNLNFPKEIILLAGAPGAGKGSITPFIQRVR